MSDNSMSYAEAAASGPTQSPEEARANPVPEIIPTDQSIDSLIDVDTSGIPVVPNDFLEQDVQTETQAARLEDEAIEAEEQAKKAAEAAAAKAAADKKAKAEKKEVAKRNAESRAANTLIIGNSIAVAVITAALGVGAYRKHQAGQLTWKVAGIWGAGAAVLAGADYFLSGLLWAKYPPGEKKQ